MNFQDFWLSNISEKNPRCKALLFDVDGTIVSGRSPLPGAENFLQLLRQSGTPFCFLTNDSDHSQEEKAARIVKSQVTAYPHEIISCGNALSIFTEKEKLSGSKVFIMGRLGDPDYAELAGLIPCREFSQIDECSFVIAGEGYYDFLRNAEAVVNYFIRHRDRKLVVPNPDSVWPNNGRVGFCAGSEARFIANILKEMKIDIDLIYLGKPHTMIFEYARDFMKKKFNLPDLQNSEIVMLGDSLESDIAGAKRFGCQSALVMTGLTTPEILKHTPPEKMPDMIFESIA